MVLDDDMKMAAFEALVPKDLADHLLLNGARLSTYELMRAEVVTVVEA